MKYAIYIIISLWGCIPLTSFAQPFESHENITTAAINLINDTISDYDDKTIQITPLDKRLRMAKCTKNLEAFLNAGTKLLGKSTIGVRCTGEKPWKIYISATINLFSDVVISNTPIHRGAVISKESLRTDRRNIAELHRGYYTTPDQIVGKIAKYTLNAENVITPSAVSMPKLVQRGKNVIIMAATGGIEVKMNGKAMADGHLGELIKIKNQRSQRIIQAKVIDLNLVSVDM